MDFPVTPDAADADREISPADRVFLQAAGGDETCPSPCPLSAFRIMPIPEFCLLLDCDFPSRCVPALSSTSGKSGDKPHIMPTGGISRFNAFG